MSKSLNLSTARIDLSELRQFVASVRSAFERDARAGSSPFHGFPNGKCGDASELLGRLIEEELGLECRVVYGASYREDERKLTHAWVEVNEFIVDVTLDQFREYAHSRDWVISKPSPAHEAYEEQRPSRPHRRPWSGYPSSVYDAASQAVRGKFNSGPF